MQQVRQLIDDYVYYANVFYQKAMIILQGGSMGSGSQRNKIFGGAGSFNYMGQQQHGNNRMIRKQHGYSHHSAGVQSKGFDPSGVGGHDDSQVNYNTVSCF